MEHLTPTTIIITAKYDWLWLNLLLLLYVTAKSSALFPASRQVVRNLLLTQEKKRLLCCCYITRRDCFKRNPPAILFSEGGNKSVASVTVWFRWEQDLYRLLLHLFVRFFMSSSASSSWSDCCSRVNLQLLLHLLLYTSSFHWRRTCTWWQKCVSHLIIIINKTFGRHSLQEQETDSNEYEDNKER